VDAPNPAQTVHALTSLPYPEGYMSDEQPPGSLMNPRRLADLTPAERRQALLRSAVRCVAVAAAVVALYYAFPFGGRIADSAVLLRLTLGAIVFVAVMAWQLRRIIVADLPELRAVETLAIVVPLFLTIYAGTYVTLSLISPASFSEPLYRTSSLYFVIVTFGTVGFGDIAPKSDLARLLVSSQIVCDLVLIGAVLRLVFGVSRRTLERNTPGSASDDR
jgi:hypothetical protein